MLDTEAEGHVINDKSLIGQQDLSKAYLITGCDNDSHGNIYSYAGVNPLFGLMIYARSQFFHTPDSRKISIEYRQDRTATVVRYLIKIRISQRNFMRIHTSTRE